jgi:hypothetical protein
MPKHAPLTTAQEIAGLKLQVKDLQKALGHLIAWMAQSANSPIRGDEASTLINMMNGHDG